MASTQPNHFNFPYFPPPPFNPFNHPPPPSHLIPPPPPSHGPPPPHQFSPPPPPSHGPPPQSPPPPHQFSPPPPHPHPHPHPPPSPFHPIVHPPPPSALLPPPPPSPNNHHPIVIVVVFVSLGGFLLLSLLAFALFCSIKKKTKKKTQETDIIHLDEHKKIKETIVTGPSGEQAVVLTIEDDVHIDEKIIKDEEKVGHTLHAESHHQGNSKSEENKKQEADIIHVDEHKKIKETVVPGPFGRQLMELSIEDDVHIDGEIKNEEKHGHNVHATSSNDQGNSNSLDAGTTTSDHHHDHDHDHHEQNQLENKL